MPASIDGRKDTTSLVTAVVPAGFEDEPDSHALVVPSDIYRRMEDDPSGGLEQLVQELLRGVTGEFHRAKVLHDWVADNISYDTRAYRTGSIGSQSFERTLRNRTAVCAGFAALYQKMCELAGLECVVVSGYARGIGYDIYAGQDPGESNHAWNAVRIGGEWRLVDVTWDAGHYGDDGSFVKEYTTDYLFPEPIHFIHMHFPKDKEWQLLEQPIPEEDFASLPYLRGEFFGFGLRLRSPLSKVSHTTGHVLVEVEAPEDVTLLAAVSEHGRRREGDAIKLDRQDGLARLDIQLDHPGHWLVRLFAARSDPYGPHSWVADLGFDNSR
ncbi:hypothetical protein JXD38_05815 [candidate division WOR-3 bacterium]|nr:hypothetical protein [candidate division WOR-3 bacterium]